MASNFTINSIEKLSEDNYETWKVQMKSVLICNDLWPYVNGGIIKSDGNEAEWNTKDEKALATILLSVSKNQINNIKKCDTSRMAWKTLKDIYESKGPVRKAILYKQLYKMRKEANVSMGEYVSKFTNTAEKLEEAGIQIPPELLSIMLLNSLPSEYESFCTAIESRDDLPTINLLKIKLIELEARFEDHETNSQKENYNDALLIRDKPKPSNKGMHNKYNKNYKSQKYEIKCTICGKRGHKANACWSKYKQLGQRTEEKAMNAVALSTNQDIEDSSQWCLDSGATRHMCKYSDKFTKINKCTDTTVYTAAKQSVQCEGIGDIKLGIQRNPKITDNIRLCNAMYVPNLTHNLLSIPQMTQYGYTINFHKNYALIKDKCGRLIFKAFRRQGLYVVAEVERNRAMNSEERCYNYFKRWHERMGHLNQNDLKKLYTENMVTGMQFQVPTKNFECQICHQGKMHRLSFKNSAQRRTDVLELIHTDICGPMRVASLGGAKYFITFIDDATRYTEVIMLKNRSEAFNAFRNYKARVEKETGKQIKSIRSDNAKEYISKEFTQYLETHGIRRQLSVEYTPQQNGVAERANRTLTEMARCMLLQSKLPETLWAEAINTANFVRMRCPTAALNKVTPIEAYTKRKPHVGFMKTFGCKAIALKKGPGTGKFNEKGETCIMVGYSSESKAYRLWLPGTNCVMKSRDVRFIETSEVLESLDENVIMNFPFTLCEEKQDSKVEETITTEKEIEETPSNNEEEREIDSEEEDTHSSTQLSVKRRPGRPKIIRTGKPGRPAKQYQQEPAEPLFSHEVENRRDKRF